TRTYEINVLVIHLERGDDSCRTLTDKGQHCLRQPQAPRAPGHARHATGILLALGVPVPHPRPRVNPADQGETKIATGRHICTHTAKGTRTSTERESCGDPPALTADHGA
ncbi:unnamed protein product, partial [Ectocarpus sp. 4 AP-2014]